MVTLKEVIWQAVSISSETPSYKLCNTLLLISQNVDMFRKHSWALMHEVQKGHPYVLLATLESIYQIPL